jgi:hypothetical protein
MIKDSEIFTLHKYFVWANKMRINFEALLNQNIQEIIPHSQFEIESNLYMSYWYGGLYVVIEGWKELGLADEKIDALLDSPNVNLLRRYRNGVFHFQRDYFDERFLGFMRDGINCVEWIRNLNLEFGRYFLTWAEQK